MAPSTLDLFMLTFNCAKNLINVAVFASHLRTALQQNATGLPDLVVFSLQEVAPLSYSFIGSYFLNPYYAAFEEALNQAAWELEPPAANADGSALPTAFPTTSQSSSLWRRKQPSYPYQLIRAHNVGMTAILLFAKTPAAIHHIKAAECGFGAADMGNKGAVGLRITYADAGLDGIAEEGAETRTTELTFVATHLAAMEWNLRRRNANWKSIVSGLTFGNPKAVTSGVPDGTAAAVEATFTEAFGATDLPEPDSDLSDDAEPLLAQDPDSLSLTKEHNDSLRDISIFRPGGYLFVGGDLNYRISTTTPPALAPFPNLNAESENYWPNFLSRDQLTQEKAAGRTLHGMSEADITFPPTYKVVVLHHMDGAVNEAELDEAEANEEAPVPWRWASHRWPGWCDRILYLDLPAWVKRRSGLEKSEVAVKAYNSLPVVRTSDHRPVFLRVQVPMLKPDEMGLPTASEQEALAEAEEQDPRLKLPVPVDIGAWDRRAVARRREIMVGWSMFLWSTREGAMVIATTLLLGVGAWWMYQGFW